MLVCVIGAGHVGLVTAACLAELGHQVICVDTDEQKISRLARRQVPIYEPGIAELIEANHRRGKLSFSTRIADAANEACDFYMFAVGTPSRVEDGGADLTGFFAAVRSAALAVAHSPVASERFSVFVSKSTVPVGTSRAMARMIGDHLGAHRYAVASNPEFLREGCAVEDFMKPERIVAGSRSERARLMLEELYRPLTRNGVPLITTTTVETAELIKYAANAFLAAKLSFINELSRLCEKLGADVEELALGIGLDSRIGTSFLKPGPGFGGSCFPKDTLALINTANEAKSVLEIVETTVRINDRHKQFMCEKIRDALGGSVAGKRIAMLGLAFKANTDDIRGSPALAIAPVLQSEGARLVVYDPAALENAMRVLGNSTVTYAASAAEAIQGVDACIIITEWAEFRTLDWRHLAPTMAQPLVIDLRNLYSPAEAARMDIDYISLGRSAVHRAPTPAGKDDHDVAAALV